jgi:hypothetical protein
MKFPRLSELEKALEFSWCKETSSDPEIWTKENHAWGQCAVTSLVLQDYFGGEIVNCKLGQISHYYNIIYGRKIDLTARQFPKGTEIPEGIPKPGNFESTRQYILSYPETVKRYFILKNLVEANL